MQTAPDRPPISHGASPTDEARTLFSADLIEEIATAVAERLEAQAKPERQLLTVREAAEYLTVSIRTLETLIAENELVPLRIRAARRFTPEALDAYLRTCASGRPRRRSS